MHAIGCDEEAVARTELGALVAHPHLEPAAHDVRRLTMRMVMQRADRACLELHAHEHEVRTMAKDLSAYPGVVGRVPRSVGAAGERLVHVGEVTVDRCVPTGDPSCGARDSCAELPGRWLSG